MFFIARPINTKPMEMHHSALSPVPPAVNLAVEDLYSKSLFSKEFWMSFGYFQVRMFAAWIMLSIAFSLLVAVLSAASGKKKKEESGGMSCNK